MRLHAITNANVSHDEEIADHEMAEEVEASSIIFELFQMKKQHDLVFREHEERHRKMIEQWENAER